MKKQNYLEQILSTEDKSIKITFFTILPFHSRGTPKEIFVSQKIKFQQIEILSLEIRFRLDYTYKPKNFKA
jgi:hypothetical protein